MNKQRRKALAAIQEKLEELQSELETLQDEEQEYYDSMPEGFQNGDKGEAAQAACELIDDAISSVQEAAELLQELN